MARTPKVVEQPNPLLEQLRFVSTILNKKGEPNETCCVIVNGAITAHNPPLSCGVLTNAAITANPPAHQLLAALERCKDGYAMTETRGTVALTSGPLRVSLPTVAGLPPSEPDAYREALPAALFDAIAQIQHVAVEEDDYVECTAICVQENFVTAMNKSRSVIVQAYHGLNLPTMMLPKRFVTRVNSVGKPIVGMGHGDSSFTVFFYDNSWLKTNFIDATAPGYDRVFADFNQGSCKPLPDIWEALDNMMPFRGNTDAVSFGEDAVKTDTASYEQILGERMRINADYLKQCKPLIENYAIYRKSEVDNGKFYFYKGNVRGVIALMD